MSVQIKEAPQKPSPQFLVASDLVCYHCRDPLPERLSVHLRMGDKSFCCEGCKSVYEILNENNLCQFYNLDERAGNTIRQQRDARAYAWLDDADTAAQLLDFSDGKRAKVTFYLPAMHCAACIWLLEHLYKLDAGVSRSTVNFPKKTVSIDFSPEKTTLRRLAAMLSSIGYPPEINLSDVENGSTRATDRSLLYKIGVAGFAFGNIMLLSFPEYLGLEKDTDGWFFGIFGWLNLLLAVPVLVYASQDYLRSAWQGLRQGHLNIDVPLSLGILMLFGRSAFEILAGTGAGYMDSFVGLVFFLLMGKWFQQKTFHALSFERDYRSYFPVAATVRCGAGEEVSTPLSKLSVGDRIVVRHGELIVADGILTHGAGHIDYSFVTGEAVPMAVATSEKVFAGGKNVGAGLLEITLTRTVSNSYLTQLWNDAAFKNTQKGSASAIADRVGRWFTYLILGVGTAAMLFWWLVRGDLATGINAFTAVFMVACPCAIAISIPFTLGNVLRLLGRQRFFVKNTQILEQIAAADAVVFDKTGTLTTADAPNTATENKAVFHQLKNRPLDEVEQTYLKSIVYLSNHPASRSILAALPSHLPILSVQDFEETVGAGVSGFVEGKYVRLGNAQFVGGKHWVAAQTHLPKGVFVKIGVEILGYFELKNRLRENLGEVIEFLKTCIRPKNSSEIYLLSGDNDRDAAAMLPFFGQHERMFFQQTPQQKLDFIKKLQANGKRVLFFGDGLNDAGALRQADVGIVVTENTNNFTPAGDAILHGDEFGRLPQFFTFIKKSLGVVRGSFVVAFLYNLVGLSFAVTGMLSPLVAAILMPLSSVTIVLLGILGSSNLYRRVSARGACQPH